SCVVQGEMQWNTQRYRPLPFEQSPVQADPEYIAGAELLPGQQPRIAQQRAVTHIAGDMAGQVVAISLAPQGTRQQHDLLGRREDGNEPVGARAENHPTVLSPAATRHRAADDGRAVPRSRCTSSGVRVRGSRPSTVRSHPGYAD